MNEAGPGRRVGITGHESISKAQKHQESQLGRRSVAPIDVSLPGSIRFRARHAFTRTYADREYPIRRTGTYGKGVLRSDAPEPEFPVSASSRDQSQAAMRTLPTPRVNPGAHEP